MVVKYYFTDFKIRNNYNAGSKAVIDVNYILEKNGYVPLFLGYGGRKAYLGKIFISLYCVIMTLIKVRTYDTIFLQYPLRINKYIKNIIYKIVKLKKCRLEILIHDLDSYRWKDNIEDSILLNGDVIICHTPKMRDILQNMGIKNSAIKILYLFDYITDSTNNYPTSFGNDIIFAGNLGKSLFISKLTHISEIQFLLYGIPETNYDSHSNLKYLGKFSPNDITDIKGDWGLVWDGDSIDTCDGLLGKYLAINSSHKLSLYIAAQKPVIIWDESSLKDFVLNNHLGIAVKSLSEIKREIATISDEEKELMRKALYNFSVYLKQGEMLSSILNSLI